MHKACGCALQGVQYTIPHVPAAVGVASQQLQALAVPAAVVQIAARLWRLRLIRKRRKRKPTKSTAASQGMLCQALALWLTHSLLRLPCCTLDTSAALLSTLCQPYVLLFAANHSCNVSPQLLQSNSCSSCLQPNQKVPQNITFTFRQLYGIDMAWSKFGTIQ